MALEVGELVLCPGVSFYKQELASIMRPSQPLPHLAASQQGRKQEPASSEQPQIWRTQSTKGFSGPRGRGSVSQKLTAAHSGSTPLSNPEDELVAVYYQPRTFEDLEDVA